MIDPEIKASIDHEALTLHLKLRRYWKAHDVRLRALEARLGIGAVITRKPVANSDGVLKDGKA